MALLNANKTTEGEVKDYKTEENNGNELTPLQDGNHNDKLKEKQKTTLRQRLKDIISKITVEPIQICYNMPSVLASVATQNLVLEKACRVNLNYTEEICDALKNREVENYTHYENEVQTLTANVAAWKNVIQTVIPCLLILFIGAYSDKTGRRKACILIPMIGELLTSFGFIVNRYFFYELPVEATALTEAIFPAITGGWYTNYLGIFSYIGDVTTKEERTYRVGLVNLCAQLGYPLGSALSGVLLRWLGFYGVFGISTSIYVIGLIYGFVYLKDPKLKTIPGNRGFLREFFDYKLVKETFSVALKKGANNRRVRVCLLIVVVFVIFGPLQGEYTVLYLFTRNRFNWNEIEYSAWTTYSMITYSCGTLFSLTLFSKHLGLDDTILGIIANVSKIASAIGYAFAKTNMEVYAVPILEALSGTSFIAMRAIASKLVSGDEFGKVNSLFGLAEAMTPMLYGPMYTWVYTKTLDVMPGAIFIMSAALTLPSLAIFSFLYFEQKKEKRRNLKHVTPSLEKNVISEEMEKLKV